MSRLIDVLTRMDEKRAPRPSLGGLPHLGESAEPRQWRILGTLVIVVGMGALALTLWLRPPPVVRPAVKPPRALAVALDRQGRRSEASRHYRAFLARSAADNPDRASIVARLDEMGRGRVAE